MLNEYSRKSPMTCIYRSQCTFAIYPEISFFDNLCCCHHSVNSSNSIFHVRTSHSKIFVLPSPKNLLLTEFLLMDSFILSLTKDEGTPLGFLANIKMCKIIIPWRDIPWIIVATSYLHLSCCSKAGVPNPRASDRYQAAQQEVSRGQVSKASSATPHCSHYCLNHRLHECLNHPHPSSMEKLSSMKPVPGAKKVGDRCSKGKQTQGFCAEGANLPVNFRDVNLHFTSVTLNWLVLLR